jgi:ABC-type nickel/cobalt efflux system permease component RcnA
MNSGLILLCINSATVALLHTLMGPDHYVPFIAMSRARRWSAWRTALVTLGCGIGHVGGSVVLGLVGVACGLGLQLVAHIESIRGNLAAWALIAFGAVYGAWGLRRAHRAQVHTHGHSHEGTGYHVHAHAHDHEHAHVHDEEGRQVSLTPWILFTVFVLGPCEPMIPLVMYPAASNNWLGLALVVLVFGTITIATMLAVVLFSLYGARLVSLGRLERYGHALAGLTILLTGCAIQVFGL